MCGFVAVFGKNDVDKMDYLLESIKHRGPDHRGGYYHKDFALGHNRLAINDLSAYSNQPFIKDDLVVVFNGEVYNAKANGFDKELDFIVAAYRTGRDFKYLLEGQYAIVIVDQTEQKITMLRDKWGICPLYYGWDSKYRLIVGSEKRVQVLAQATISELAPGEMQVRVLGNRYPELSLKEDRRQQLNLGYFNKHIALNLLYESVGTRCRHTEVGYDVALSGGLDSCLLVTVMKNIGLNINTHTISFEGCDDGKFAVEFAKDLSIEHTVYNVTEQEILNELPKMLYHLEDPIPNEVKFRGYVRNWFVAKYAKSKVIISGEGADELFGGYPQFKGCDSIEMGVKRQSAIKSMRAINLDRVDRGGMAWGKEYRMPYLGYQFADYVLSCVVKPEKHDLKELAKLTGVPDYIINRPKYGSDEAMFHNVFQKAKEIWK